MEEALVREEQIVERRRLEGSAVRCEEAQIVAHPKAPSECAGVVRTELLVLVVTQTSFDALAIEFRLVKRKYCAVLAGRGGEISRTGDAFLLIVGADGKQLLRCQYEIVLERNRVAHGIEAAVK